MNPTPCTPCCSTSTTVNVPGTSGSSAITVTTASFTIPAVGSSVTPVAVGDTTWIKNKANVFVSDGSKWGNFIATVNSSTSLSLQFLGFNGASNPDSAVGQTIASGAVVMPGVGDLSFPWDLDLLTAFTDNSGGTKSDTIAATLAKQTLTVGPFLMTAVVNAQSWGLAVPFNFTLNSVLMRCDIAMTSGGASAGTFTSRINSVAATGGVVSASGAYATGATQAGTAVSGGNTGTAGQVLDVLLSGITVWTAGYAHFEFNVTNTDLTATLAAIAFKANQLRTALRHL